MLRIVCFAVFILSAAMPAQADIKINKYMTYLSDGDRIEVVIGEVRKQNKALIEVHGVNSDIDDVVLMAEILKSGNRTSYRIKFDGENYYLLIAEKRGSDTDYTFYLPDNYGSETKLNVNKDGFRAAEDLLATYKAQLADGIQAELARFHREDHVSSNKEGLQQADQRATDQCGHTITTQVNWAEITDAQLMELSIQGFCGQVAEAMASQCESDDAAKTRLTPITTVECKFADSLTIKKENSRIIFQTEKDTANQYYTIDAFLKTL